MGTALYQYFGILTAMDCSTDIIFASLSGFVGGVLLTLVINLLINDQMKK